jgi:NTP pyrophosphatase (non-canonical NTP hydrolase)
MTKDLTIREYQELCQRTAKKFDNTKEEILTWGLGIAGEAGDVASCIKKTIIHENDQELGIRENLGDTMWYMAMICNHFHWDFQEILNENIAKLLKRYPDGFDLIKAQRENSKVDWNEN